MKPEKTSYDFHQLEVFCGVVETGSFSAAAARLGLTQPTVSAHIMAVEKNTGVSLIDRKGRNVQPTAAGRVFYNHALKMLAMKNEADRSIGMLADIVTGSVVIGGSNIPGTYFLPRSIAAFRKERPGVAASLKVGGSQEVIDMADAGEVELAVVGKAPAGKNFEYNEIWSDELVLVVYPGHPRAADVAVSVRALAVEPFIMREKGSAMREFMEKTFADKGVKLKDLNIVCELGGTESVKQAVIAGAGVAVLSSKAIEAEERAGLLRGVPIRGSNMRRRFLLIRDKRRALSAAAEAFHSFVLGDNPY
jgi:DNA-binding transcriptional LysR family regulator